MAFLLPSYLTEQHQIYFHLILVDFYKKNCMKGLFKNHLKIDYAEFGIHA